jgi:hypothetical protein
VRGLAAALTLTALAVPASASADWGPREEIPLGAGPLSSPAGGPVFVRGYSFETDQIERYALRPFDGVMGAPQDFGAGIADFSNDVGGLNLDFDSAGNAVVIREDGVSDNRVAYRSVANVWSDPDPLPLGWRPRLVSVAPTGESMIGIQAGASAEEVVVAFRPAGPDAEVDDANAEAFSANGTLVGLQLQPDGGAVVVWQEGDELWQAVRPAGEASFADPAEIPSPTADPRKFSVKFDSDSSGWSILTWRTAATNGGAVDTGVVSVREPNGAFGAPQVIGSHSGSGLVTLAGAITSTGAAIAVWDVTVPAGSCTHGYTVAAFRSGGAWGSATPIGPAPPVASTGQATPVGFSAGSHIAVPLLERHLVGDTCTVADDKFRLTVRHFQGSAGTLVDRGTSELSPFELTTSQTPAAVGLNRLVIEPGGKMLAHFQLSGQGGSERYLRAFDGVVPTQPPPDDDDDPDPPGNGGNPPGQNPPPILEIVPRRFVTLKPIDPKKLLLKFQCVIGENTDENCVTQVGMYMYFTGKKGIDKAFKPEKPATKSAKKKPFLLAKGSATAAAGQTKNVKLKPTKLGKRAIRSRKGFKVELKVTVAVGDDKATQTLKTKLKAGKKR